MTMPTLLANHRKKEISTSVKKFYTTMSQAILMSEIDNGPSKDWEKEAIEKDEDGNIDNDVERGKALTYFNRYIANYIKYVKVDENPEDEKNADGETSVIKVYLADGNNFTLQNGSCAHFTYDANGNRKPNEHGRDKFGFLLCPPNYSNIYIWQEKGTLGPYCSSSGCATRNKALETCENDPKACSGLLMYDNWEFSAQYPYKL